MKTARFRIMMFCLMFAWLFGACDPTHKKEYKIIVPTPGDIGKNPDDRGRLSDVLDAIEGIALKHGMKSKPLDQPLRPELLHRVYYGQYKQPSTRDKSVHIDATADSRTGEVIIKIMDVFRTTQSQFSKDLEQDLLNEMKVRYGESSIQEK